MSSIFEQVKGTLAQRLPEVLPDLLPGGKVSGKEYLCASLEGGAGTSCSTSLETGKGSDFATGDSWGDIIALAAKVWHMRQGEAANELARKYGIGTDQPRPTVQPQAQQQNTFTPMLPVPANAPEPPRWHSQHGARVDAWAYTNALGETLFHAVRFETPTGKVVLPLCCGQYGNQRPQWAWQALPAPRPLYNLPAFYTLPASAPVLLVEGEKTADAAKVLFPQHVVTTWSGGANAFAKTDFSPMQGRTVIIWPNNDAPGFKAALELLEHLRGIAGSMSVVLPPDTLPESWDIADATMPGFIPQLHMETAMPPAEFVQKAAVRFPALAPQIQMPDTPPPDPEEMQLREWPQFPWDACPGLLGEFVRLATQDSEADPAAICVTALVRFGAEIYGHAPNMGPHIYVGETIHPPRLFAVICGNSSKARKGTSRHPVSKLFTRQYCYPSDLQAWQLPLPARESGGPLSTGEGLAHAVRDETDEERERKHKLNPNEPIREKGDKRLMIQDEEFASGLACIKREGNTLSMGIRCFWDSGDYAPLTKNNPVLVKGAHISIITHITMQELAVCLGEVQAVNGFGNRFLWVCARRAKLVPLPSRMPEAELAPMQRELWRLVAHAQKRGAMKMHSTALELWEHCYPELSKEHSGLAGSIVNRAEAQTLRLALVYALLDGADHIAESHLKAALAMWQYAQASALYIFGDKAADPLEEKVLEALKNGPLTATELNRVFSGHISKDRLQPILQQLEAQRRIAIAKQKNGGRPRLVLSLCEGREESGISEKSDFSEIREEA
ncbi:DUF3987 domain-containing protein [Desulfovibrio cuneatus]|uniref:DUF3987 domain-containing protein n=1 Tax=Desulfovibrio cuneatus TaxID=159728 RepID=UPI00041746AE|nr:DUF3987 domain-containing protein [Desulfovibrio cuneatus]